MKILLRIPPLPLAFLLAGIFLLILKSLTFSSFETNDDALFMMFCSGFYTGKPFEYLIATSVFTGKVLSILYTYFSDINWYGWYLIGGHYLAITGFFYSALKNFKSSQILILFGFVLILFESYFLAYIQFTTTAFLCGISGYLVLVTNGFHKINWQSYILGFLLIMVSILIRPAIFGYTTALYTPIFLFLSLKSKTYNPSIVLIFCALAYFSLEMLDSNYKGTFAHWKEYKEYFNNEFHGLVDAPNITFKKPLAEVLSKVGWTDNDFEMLKIGFFEDQKLYSEKKIKLLFEEFNTSYSPFKFEQSKILAKILIQYKYQTVFTLCLSLAALLILYNDKLRLFTFVTSLLMICCLVYFMGSFTILKSRVLIPTLLILNIVGIVLFHSEIKNYLKSKWTLTSLGVISILLLAKIYINDSANIQPRIRDYAKEYSALSGAFKGKVLAVWQTSLAFDNIDILNPIYKKDSEIKFYYLDWLSGFPVQSELLAKYGQKDIYSAILTNEFYIILDNSHFHKMNHLITYYKEHLNLGVEAKKVAFKMPDESLVAYSIYKLEVRPKP